MKEFTTFKEAYGLLSAQLGDGNLVDVACYITNAYFNNHYYLRDEDDEIYYRKLHMACLDILLFLSKNITARPTEIITVKDGFNMSKIMGDYIILTEDENKRNLDKKIALAITEKGKDWAEEKKLQIANRIKKFKEETNG